MSKILLLEQEVDLGDNLKFLFEDKGYSIDWRQNHIEIKNAFEHVPDYDIAIVDRCCDENNPSFTCDELVQKLKKIHPNKEIICLTHPHNPCRYADKNFDILDLLDEFRISYS